MFLQKPHQRKLTRPPLPWTVKLALSIISAVTDIAFRPNGTANRRLIHFLDYQTSPASTSSISSSDISIDAARSLWVRLYTPSDNRQLLPVLVFFHGGGFSFLTAASVCFDLVCRNFASKLSAIVISVNYRLAPEHRYPSQHQDGFDAVNFIDQNWTTVLPKNADRTRCFLAGDSAGANLAHHVAIRACRTKALGTVKIIGLISIQPFFGGEERTESEIKLMDPLLLVSVPRTDWCWKAYLPEGSNRDHGAANVSGPNADDISELDFPATMVVVGGFDPLKDWQRRYYEWLLRSGKEASLTEYPNMIHAFYAFPQLLEASHLHIQINKFIAKCSSSTVADLKPVSSPPRTSLIRLPILCGIFSFIYFLLVLCISSFN
ncbi:putative carboxylesterase 18 [Hibiscus syriacus]|uniref:Carboxylesterase 18 n=1 Tax=Hibiscus syriacus TaxID=106335 RepID=A0A6A3CE52_HIBSY|nr:probable carboxylesterase 18 [Hibiscus syriacus]KAE8725419.1 putative carboxylesterase 18 [Hibiscus syriacus]